MSHSLTAKPGSPCRIVGVVSAGKGIPVVLDGANVRLNGPQVACHVVLHEEKCMYELGLGAFIWGQR